MKTALALIAVLIVGCGIDKLPAGISEGKARAACADVKEAERITGYNITEDDIKYGIEASTNNKRRRLLNAMLQAIARKHEIESGDILIVYDYGRSKGW